jgi:Amt family ammonium transporter
MELCELFFLDDDIDGSCLHDVSIISSFLCILLFAFKPEYRTPALAFFYGGLVDTKNILNQLFLSFICMAIVTVQWCLFGFSFSFGPGNSGFGSFQFGAFNFHSTTSNLYGFEPDTVNAQTISLLTFACYEAAFAVITPALISGAVVGRMKLLPYMLFIFLWSTLCYDPLCRWIFSPLGLFTLTFSTYKKSTPSSHTSAG